MIPNRDLLFTDNGCIERPPEHTSIRDILEVPNSEVVYIPYASENPDMTAFLLIGGRKLHTMTLSFDYYRRIVNDNNGNITNVFKGPQFAIDEVGAWDHDYDTLSEKVRIAAYDRTVFIIKTASDKSFTEVENTLTSAFTYQLMLNYLMPDAGDSAGSPSQPF